MKVTMEMTSKQKEMPLQEQENYVRGQMNKLVVNKQGLSPYTQALIPGGFIARALGHNFGTKEARLYSLPEPPENFVKWAASNPQLKNASPEKVKARYYELQADDQLDENGRPLSDSGADFSNALGPIFTSMHAQPKPVDLLSRIRQAARDRAKGVTPGSLKDKWGQPW